MAQLNLTMNIPDEVITAIQAWMDTQKEANGTPIYASAQALMKSILKDAVLRILAESPSAAIKNHMDAIKISQQQIETLRNSAAT
jgi:hypothetical protein